MTGDLSLRSRAERALQEPRARAFLGAWDFLWLGLALGLDPSSFSLAGVWQALRATGFRLDGDEQGNELRAVLQSVKPEVPFEQGLQADPGVCAEKIEATLARLEWEARFLSGGRRRSSKSEQAPAATREKSPGKGPSARAKGKPEGKATAQARAKAAGKAAEQDRAPAEPPAPPLPAAPACTPPQVGIEAFGALEVSSWERATPAQLLLTLAAHRLAIAQTFDELLAPAAVSFVPHRYQIETARKVLRVLRGRAMLSDEVGLGKTIEAMLVLREYQLRGLVRRALVLVPAPLVAQWVGELADKAGISAHTFDEALETPEEFWASEGVLVVSMALARGARHMPLAQAQPWDLVAVDEAHHVKNSATQGWKLVDGLKSRFLLLLTATPIEKSLDEIYSLVTLLRPGQFKTAQAFRKAYVDPKNPTSPRNREQLRALLGEVMIRNTRAQSGLKLPPRYVSTVAIDTSPSEQSLYGAVVDLLRAHHDDTSARLVTTTLLLEAGSSVAALRGTLDKMSLNPKHKAALRRDVGELARKALAVREASKLRAMEAILAENPGKVLIFTRFRETLLEVTGRLRELGIPTVGFHGGLNAQQKKVSLDDFRGTARILVASDVGGEGQNLQFCSTLINYDLPWNPMLLEQRIGRLHRMGQEREVRVYNLCARGTAEERVLDVLDRRVHLFELVVGEMDMVLGNLEDDRDLEERVMDLYARSRDDGELSRGFDALAAELLTARGLYERTRAFDEALFGKDYEA